MEYKELLEELKELQNEEFCTEFIDKIMTIVSRMRRNYYNDFFSDKKTNKDLYNELSFMVNNILKTKLKELNRYFTNANINDIVSGIIGNHLFVNDILKLEDYVFIEGRTSFNFSDKNILLSVNTNLKDIVSADFSECLRKVNYINSAIGKNTINRLVDILNVYLKNYFNVKYDFLTNVNNSIIYNLPLVTIQLNKNLDDICNGIINNDVYNIEVVVMCNEEVHLFDLKLGSDTYDMEEVDSDIWMLSKSNSKEKNK